MLSNIVINCYYYINSFLFVNNNIEYNRIKNKNIVTIDDKMDRDIYMNGSNNTNVIIHKCGYCMQNIDVPTYRYNDTTFCNTKCRHKKIVLDCNM